MQAGNYSYMNPLIAAYMQQASDPNVAAARQTDSRVRSDAQSKAAEHGAGANTTIRYSYDVGPDGQLYASGATISSSTRSRGDANRLDGLRDAENALDAQSVLPSPYGVPAKPGDFTPPRALLSPADEVAIFGAEEFYDANGEDYAARTRRDRLQLADFAVRAQERQHFAAAAGLGSAPVYEYEVGPDGELYAVGGNVSINPGPAGSEEEAARDAAAVGRAALAATDVSAQDISVARDAQSKAAYLYSINRDITYNQYKQIDLAA
tara:strand:+ start:434 stop:1228 length:795 start_codon:yes stop_codon:yes gene_type:complete